MVAVLIHNLDPVMVRFGPVAIRYYGVVFVLTLLVGFLFWRWQMLRVGHSQELTYRFLVWGVVATIAGARLGHCLFYEPETYLSDPITILYVWQGGLASHGATIGLLVALFLFARANHLKPLELMDRFTLPAAVGAAGIRMANFLNSEIVGRVTTVPWAVRFMHYETDALPRHPSQLYEFTLGLLVLLILYIADRLAGREKRPLGLLTGLFLTVYFGGRFVIEFFKEYQTQLERETDSFFTMGQFLSVVPIIAGVALLVWVWRTRKPTDTLHPPAPARTAKVAKIAKAAKSRKSRR